MRLFSISIGRLLLVPLLISSSAMAGERLMLLKFQGNDQPLFAIGPVNRQTTSLTNFLKTAYVQTNLTGMVEWINKTNLSRHYLEIATPDASEPIAKLTQPWLVLEWLPISSSLRRVDTNAPSFKPTITPEQAITVAKKQVVANGWKAFEVDIPSFEKGEWHMLVKRLPPVMGGHAFVEISPDGKITYSRGR